MADARREHEDRQAPRPEAGPATNEPGGQVQGSAAGWAARATAAAGHLAVWTGLYVAASVVCFLEGLRPGGVAGVVGGSWRGWAGVALGLCMGLAAYLLDRVKLRDAWLDEADRQAHPERFAYLFPRRRRVRAAIAALSVVGAALALALHPLLAVVVVLSLVGVVLYAGVPRRAPLPPGARRIKDVFILKNAAVAGGITAFAAVVSLAVVAGEGTGEPVPGGELSRAGLWRWAWPVVFVFAHVLADSMLCDIDDIEADRRFGTQTLAWRGSARAVRTLAVVVALVLLGWTLAGSVGLALDGRDGALAGARLLWAALMAATTIGLVFVPEGRLRDAVDLRLPVVAVVALLAVG